MYICFALLTDDETHNISRKMVYELSNDYGINTISARLPQHITLKQSFKVNDIKEIEKYFDELAKSINSFQVKLSDIELLSIEMEGKKNQILWFEVQENPHLRQLHNRLNKELFEFFGTPRIGYDGDSWKFHSSIAYGFDQENQFKKHYDRITKLKERAFDVRRIAMFYCPDDELNFVSENFISYKISSINL